MYKYNYDLHIHSCLSPCGDSDMTPNNIANMSALKALDIIALSDHNSAKNARAVAAVIERERLPLIFIPALELTTAEDIHIVLYFPDCDAAEAFENQALIPKRIPLKNRPDIFGEQIIMDSLDREIGREENLLINAADIPVDQVMKLAAGYGAEAVPAHIDKDANSLLSTLGAYPDYIGFRAAEIKNAARIAELTEKYPLPKEKILTNSDAHFLWDIKEKDASSPLLCEKKILSPKDFLAYLRG